jgi:DNA-binding transcriptional MerR regulator
MEMVIGDLVEQSGVAARTIREYIRLELLPRPKGVGPAALYQREHLLRLWVIVAWKKEGKLPRDMKSALGAMTAREMARFKPKEEGAQASGSADTAAAAPEVGGAAEPSGAPASARHSARDGGRASRRRLGASTGQSGDSSALESLDAGGEALPGQRYSLVPLLPGMILMVRDDAPSIVRRAALEIVDRYGAGAS